MKYIARILLPCVLAASTAGGDIVYTNDGKVYRGEVTREGDRVLIKGPLATIAVDARDVRRIIESKSPATTQEAPQAATLTLDVPRTGPDAYLRPESHVFLQMRQLAGTPMGMGSLDIQEQIKAWRAKVHDRMGRYRNGWVGPDDFARARREFNETLKKTQPLMNDLRRAGATTTSGRAAQAKYRRSLSTYFRQAASVWPDELMGDFLMALALLEGYDYLNAQQLLEKCQRAAPRVAAFPQGKAMALSGRGQKLAALSAYLEVLHLMPDSREAYDMVVAAMEDTPGDQMLDQAYVTAKAIVGQYEAPPKRSYGLRGVTWLMPGRPWLGREFTLPVPPYDRLVFRQAIGVPVGKNALMVDARAMEGAQEAFVRIGANVVVPAAIQRTGTYGVSKEAASLVLVTVQDFEFQPLKTEGVAPPVKGQSVEVYGLNLHEEMGGEVRPMEAVVQDVLEGGQPALTQKLVAGEVAGPVMTKDGQLLGFLDAKADALAEGGGADRFVPIAAAEMLLKRATRTGSYFGGYGRIKRTITSRPAAGKVFVVHITASEGEPLKRF